MGGALGLAIAVSIFASQAREASSAAGVADAFSVAYLVVALVAFAGAAAALLVLRGVRIETRAPEETQERTATSAFSVNRNTTASLTTAFLTGQEAPDQPRPDAR
jgi:hypothetical protein